jgi:biopolymer transport protein ExbB/TolQ
MLSSNIQLGQSLKNRINALLFWGAVGAVVGLLGQASGIYAALRAISTASEISPPIVMEGFAISFLTTMMGLMIFLGSGLAWMGLRGMYNRLSRAVPA